MQLNRTLTRRRVLALGSAFAATALLAACGEVDRVEDGGSNSGGTGAGDTDVPTGTVPSPTEKVIEYPTGSDDLVINVEYQGGYVMPETLVRRLPIAALYGDGRLIYPGPQIEIFPPPALPNLLMTRLNVEGMQQLLRLAQDAGLLTGDVQHLDMPGIADAPTTVFSFNVEGETTQFYANALGIGAGPGSAGAQAGGKDVDIRTKLASFLSELTSAPQSFPASAIAEPEHAYTIERLQLVTSIYDPQRFASDVEPNEIAWPLAVSPDEIGSAFNMPGFTSARCAVVEDDDLAAMLAALESASELTRWIAADTAYFLINRPLLPGESGCVHPFADQPDDQTEPDATFEHPKATDEVVIRYERTGGFAPAATALTRMPVFSLQGDGRIYTPGAQIAIYPPPALPAIAVTKVAEDGIQRLLAAAGTAGLIGESRDFDDLTNTIADAETGVLMITTNGSTTTTTVYAPDFTERNAAVSQEELEFRAQFDGFIDKLHDVRSWLPEADFLDVADGYPVNRLNIVSQRVDKSATSDAGIDPGHIDWPLDTPLAQIGEPMRRLESRCFVLEGQDLANLMPLLSEANTLTRWDSDDESYVFHIRPLLPGDQGCSLSSS